MHSGLLCCIITLICGLWVKFWPLCELASAEARKPNAYAHFVVFWWCAVQAGFALPFQNGDISLLLLVAGSFLPCTRVYLCNHGMGRAPPLVHCLVVLSSGVKGGATYPLLYLCHITLSLISASKLSPGNPLGPFSFTTPVWQNANHIQNI